MTTPEQPDWYQQMLDEIIQMVQDDDTANSETVEAMVQRLRELQALGEAEFLARKINTDNGITGGGDLSADRTLALSDGVLTSLGKADSAVQPEALTSALEPYLSESDAAAEYVTKAEAGVSFVPFSRPGTINGETTSPPLALPGAVRLLGVSVAANTVDSRLTVTVSGGASATISLEPGATTADLGNLSSTINGPLRVKLASSSATGVTVTLRVQAVAS